MTAHTLFLAATLLTLVAGSLSAVAWPNRIRRATDDYDYTNLESGEVVNPDGTLHEDPDDFVDQLVKDRAEIEQDGGSFADWGDRIEEANRQHEQSFLPTTTEEPEAPEERPSSTESVHPPGGPLPDPDYRDYPDSPSAALPPLPPYRPPAFPVIVSPRRPTSRRPWPEITFARDFPDGPNFRTSTSSYYDSGANWNSPTFPSASRRPWMYPREPYSPDFWDQQNSRSTPGVSSWNNQNGFGAFGNNGVGLIGGFISGIGRGIASAVDGVSSALANKWNAKAAAARRVASSVMNTGGVAVRAGVQAGMAHPRFAVEAFNNVIG